MKSFWKHENILLYFIQNNDRTVKLFKLVEKHYYQRVYVDTYIKWCFVIYGAR